MNMKEYFCVTSIYYNDGHVTATITDTKQAEKKPKKHFKETVICEIYTDWFDSENDAQAFIKMHGTHIGC